MAMKKGPTKGSGGKHRNKLKGKGPTPKAEDRVYHKAYRAKKAADRRKMADPRLAARRRAAKFTSDSDDLVIGRNAVVGARPEEIENKEEWGVTVVGAGCTVAPGAVVPPKAMIEEGTVYEEGAK